MAKIPILGDLADLLFGEEVLDVSDNKNPVSDAGRTLSEAKGKKNERANPDVGSIIKPSSIKPKSDDSKPADPPTGTSEGEKGA